MSGFEGPKWWRCGNEFAKMIQREVILSSILGTISKAEESDYQAYYYWLTPPDLLQKNKLWQTKIIWVVSVDLMLPFYLSLLCINPPLRIVNTPQVIAGGGGVYKLVPLLARPIPWIKTGGQWHPWLGPFCHCLFFNLIQIKQLCNMSTFFIVMFVWLTLEQTATLCVTNSVWNF